MDFCWQWNVSAFFFLSNSISLLFPYFCRVKSKLHSLALTSLVIKSCPPRNVFYSQYIPSPRQRPWTPPSHVHPTSLIPTKNCLLSNTCPSFRHKGNVFSPGGDFPVKPSLPESLATLSLDLITNTVGIKWWHFLYLMIKMGVPASRTQVLTYFFG